MNENCLKLTAYFGERQRTDGHFLAEQLLALYGRERVATSIMLRGTASFGPRHQLRTDSSLSLSEDPPVTVAAVDTDTKISRLVEAVIDLTPRGLVTVERARLIGAEREDDAEGFVIPPPVHDAVKLTVVHDEFEPGFDITAISQGWPGILSSLKTLMETGRPMSMSTRRWAGPPK